MKDFLLMNYLYEDVRFITDNIGIFLICMSGILAILTPIINPMWFIPSDRQRYMRTFRNANILIGPSACVFVILLLSWELILSALFIPHYQAIPIIGSVYLYILIIYSFADENSSPSMSAFLTINLITIVILYDMKITIEHKYLISLALFITILTSWKLHWRNHSITQNIQWYMWYAGTFGATLRW